MQLSIIPQPRQLHATPGSFQVRNKTCAISRSAADHVAIRQKLSDLSLRPKPVAGDVFIFTLGNPGVLPKAPEYAEGYAVSIEPSGVSVVGHDLSGLFWGLTTLEQIMAQSRELPCVQIRDYPLVPVRYHHDDISRKQVSTLEHFKTIVRRLSQLKINHYTLYIEDMLHLPSFPDIGEGRGKLMPDEVKAIVEEGRRHNVTVFPTYSLIGHQENLLKLPHYRHLAREVWQSPSSLDPAKPQVREFLKRVIPEVCQAFPGELFHMCFDETQGLDAKTFLSHANWCAQQLEKQNRRPLMWVDMIYNHFGYREIRKLHPSIIPVNWQYGDTLKEVPHQKQLLKQGRDVWGLAAYSSTCTFLPDPASSRTNFAGWVKEIQERPIGGLGASIWGDDGYENHRDLPWEQYATFAEYAWSGDAADLATLDARFEQWFYGTQLPLLRKIIVELPGKLSATPHEIWRWHRRNPNAMVRQAAANPRRRVVLERDRARVDQALLDLAVCRKQAKRNADQLEHVAVALDRNRLVLDRLVMAYDCTKPITERKLAGQCLKMAEEIVAARKRYKAAWLRTNRPENIEVSLEIFDRAQEQYLFFPARFAQRNAPAETGDQPLDLSRHWNQDFGDIFGLPIGTLYLDGTPFRFADEKHTHYRFTRPGEQLTLPFDSVPVKDLHFIIAGQKPKDGKPAPSLRVELLRGKQVVFSEDLLSVQHICDWWAPFGEHMWAGGGLRYTDPMRVRPALRPELYYGMMHLSNFGLTGTPAADRLRLTALTDLAVHVFGVTLEVPKR